MHVLGISAFYHDSAAALIHDGRIVAAAQEERFTRIKHDASFPSAAIQYCLAEGGVSLDDVDYICFFEKPLIKFERLLETYLASAPRGFQSFRIAMPVWIKDKLFQKAKLLKLLKSISDNPEHVEGKLLFSEHHLSHAASAFYASPFNEAIVLTMDGVGEWATTSISIGNGNKLDIVRELHWPHSLGLLYSAFTYYLGFKVNSGEYKVMGLAPYGEPIYADIILNNLVSVRPDGSFWLDQSYFNYVTGLTMTSGKFESLFGNRRRTPEADLTTFHMDIAASIQAVTELIVLRIISSLSEEFPTSNLCLAGGVALNCVANGKILKSQKFKNIWIQPASGDAGGALGAAYQAYYGHLQFGRPTDRDSNDRMEGAMLGPHYTQSEVEDGLRSVGAVFETLTYDEMLQSAARAIADNKIVGWFQGRMEYGPRALGGRSILGDPRNTNMQKLMNVKIKYRESFRPFAPSVLREDVAKYFDLDVDSPYMLLVADVVEDRRIKMSAEEAQLFGIEKLNIPRSDIPAVTHVDYSARVQTVSRDSNPIYYDLLQQFKKITACSVLINTSFNVRGEPIVNTPQDAFRCFMGCGMDNLFIGNCRLAKEAQDRTLAIDYSDTFELD